MSLSCESNPDGRHDIRAHPKTSHMGLGEYMGNIKKHTEEWTRESMFVKVLELCETDVLVYMEDDYLAPPESVVRLLELLEMNPDAAMTSTVQTYRCPNIQKMGIAPAETIVFDSEKIVRKTCCDPGLRGVHEVVGTSFSCFAARVKDLRESIELIRLKGLLMTYIGHDVVVTNVITKLGRKILVDFELWGEHMQLLCLKHACRIHTFGKGEAVQDTYVWDRKVGSYINKLGR